DGFVPPVAPAVNDEPLPTDAASLMGPTGRKSECTFSTHPMGRETYPITCVEWDAARAFCRFYGGGGPFEPQWAYGAQAAGRPHPTPYGWGGLDTDFVPCSRSVFARTLPTDVQGGDVCVADGFGPQPVDARIGPQGDVSLGLGVVNLGGSVSEWMRDEA